MKRKTWVLAGAAVLVAATATGGVVAMSSAKQATAAAQEPPANTVKVERGKLSAMVSQDGTLTYRARSDGSPYAVINQARGTYTELPDVGDKVDCGDVLYRVDDHPVLLLCGTVPAYRDLHSGDVGNDVRQLNANLHMLGYDAGVELDPDDNASPGRRRRRSRSFSTTRASTRPARSVSVMRSSCPSSVRIAKVTGRARWIRPAGCTGRAGHIRHARGAGGPRRRRSRAR